MASTEPIENGINSSEPETATVPQSEPEKCVTLSADGTMVETEHEAEPELAASEMAAEAETETAAKLGSNDQNGTNSNVNKWPGWPGDCVFRLVVPVLKVGSIIGRKGELIKKMCEETRARIRVLEGPISSSDRIVLISGKEEPEAPFSPAMDAVIRIFKRISGLPENEIGGKTAGAAAVAFSSVRLLVASTQAISLIGKQGSLIKSIQESTSASVRVLSTEETPGYVSSEERIVELQGEALKVLKALEAVVGHLRKFLVDHSVLPLFEKNYKITSSQERPPEAWSDKPLLLSNPHGGRVTDYPLPIKRDSAFFERESHLEPQVPSTVSLFGQDPGLSGIRASAFARGGAPIVTQVSQTMQIPLNYAEDIIGVQGTNIAYIRRTSGAILTVQESRGLPDEITVEIKGTSAQVQTAQQLIQEFISGRHDPHTLDTGLRTSYSQLSSGSYSSSSYPAQPYGSYGSSGTGGYSSFRL